jgi:transposase-like protein
MARRKRRKFTPEFKAEAVRLVRSTGRSVGQVAKELDLTETALREWVRQADVEGARKASPGALSDAERSELAELRRKVKRLEMEREILKKAAVFFAQESK